MQKIKVKTNIASINVFATFKHFSTKIIEYKINLRLLKSYD